MSFSIILSLGIMIGLGWLAWRMPAKQAVRAIDQALPVLAGALCGGRLLHVVVEWGYYQAHPLEIPQVWLGGLSGIGAILGALLALPIAAALFHEPAGALADRLLPLGAMVVVSSWLACWYAGCAYGVLVNTWWALPARDEGGAFQKRFPLQLIGAVLAVGSFWLLDRLYSSSKWLSRMRKGTTAVLGLFCFSLELFGLSFFRGDVFHPSDLALFWFGWRQDAWAALGLAITAGIGFIFLLAARYFEQKGEV